MLQQLLHQTKIFRFIDESLRWLIANGRVKESKAIIVKACKENNKNYDEVVEISGFDTFEMNHGMMTLHVEPEKGTRLLHQQTFSN